jgi:hypothetical protein
MEFKSGKHEGQTTEEVLLKKADYAQWLIAEYPDSLHAKAFKQRMRDFDSKPFTENCNGKCGHKATRASAYRGGNLLYFWCDDCNPSSSGAEAGKLAIVRTIGQLLQHVDWSANGNREFKRRMVRQLAEAKGLPTRVGRKQALMFFN